MIRCVSIAVAVGGVILSSQTTSAQSVIIENVMKTPPASMVIQGPFGWTDYADLERTVTVPSGTAVITWSFGNFGGTQTYVRPVIAGQSPLEDSRGGLGNHNGGSWVTHVDAGEISVKFEVRSEQRSSQRFDTEFHTASYTLIVFPDTPSGYAAAVSSSGLGVLALLILGLGSMVAMRRTRRHTA